MLQKNTFVAYTPLCLFKVGVSINQLIETPI